MLSYENNIERRKEMQVKCERYKEHEINKEKAKHCESKIRYLEDELIKKKEVCNIFQEECEEKMVHTDYIEDKLANSFRKNLKMHYAIARKVIKVIKV